jgi:hypothetical protein
MSLYNMIGVVMTGVLRCSSDALRHRGLKKRASAR